MSQFIAFLMLQGFVGFISLAASLIIVSVVIFLIATSAKNEDETSVEHKVNEIRGRYVFGLSMILAIILFVANPNEMGNCVCAMISLRRSIVHW